MIKLYKYIIGFLSIRITGEETEKLLNICANKRIRIWNLKYKNRMITGEIGIKDFKALRIAKRGIKASVKIIKKTGLPFKIKNIKGRSGLIVGCIVFIFLLKFLSLFVWGVQISGNEEIDAKDILSACEKLGIKEGAAVSKLDTAILAQQIPLNVNGISWCSVNVEGCYVTVNISESKKEKAEDLPSNLKATADGIIEKIDVTSGETLVKIGDTVAIGDILVSGITESNNCSVFLKSRGNITAKTTRTIEKSGSFCSKNFVTYKKKNKTVLDVFSLKIPLYLGKEKEPYSSKISTNKLKLFGKEIPIGSTTKTFYLKKEKTVLKGEESLKIELRKEIEKEILSLGISDYEIIEEETEINNKTLTVKRTISAVENIAKEEKIIFNK